VHTWVYNKHLLFNMHGMNIKIIVSGLVEWWHEHLTN